ncbi:MAG: peptidyl-alpha-hydroxyglycine alpha-amidating lyase family protein [Polymorphobacter sp.]|uniref:peptidyl-alpha-hydroxyglycine alpha-amidating lyase family protein n=1 Tax=Polymorphobacter sp. TaxID=1909290 RepID=UPI003A862B67
MKTLMVAALALAALGGGLCDAAMAQRVTYTLEMLPPPGPLRSAPNSHPNPYAADAGFFRMPAGRVMGSTSAVAVDSKGHVWVAERCGANSCAGSSVNPIMEFDGEGNFIRNFGGGLTVFPHGFFIDHEDNVWLTDARVAGGMGGQVFKFSPDGQLLLTLGTKGVAGTTPATFTEPNAVYVSKEGTIFVADGHTPYRNIARIVKFAPDGRYLGEFGKAGRARGELEVPHALAMDSKGRLFVADRWNNRISIFTQDGEFIDAWTQFGRPSGIYIDANDVLYSADSESRRPVGYGFNPGWKRGIRIGSAITGKVTAFIADPEPEPDRYATSSAEGIWVDRSGVIYGAQVKERSVIRYFRAR